MAIQLWIRIQHREHTEWQCTLSGVHPIMMVKSALPGVEGRGVYYALPLSFYLPSRAKQTCGVRSRWEGRYTSPISHLSLYVLCGKHRQIFKLVNVFIIVSCVLQVCAFHLAIMGILTMHLSVSGAVVLLGGVLLLAPVFPSLWLLGLFWAERLWGAAHVIKRDSHEILIGCDIKLNPS